ncbi:ABC transporter ATP-binding protein [Microbacterium sp. No. 7]|uniref:ABC transporter ATP-binding protein n=1 Tax=Microbacterium sp. No. 7 TaxID=1714373 RepID=UPI0006D15B03|nr:ATP-binding cassette domain-containing protein [Microbacterium sp. No. 7]ALJ20810.1 ABC transporter ATP-binding protein [Microbacterium sp. No. 7]
MPLSDTAAPDHAIEVRNLSKTFGDRVAVEDLSFVVRRGSIVGLLGPNGAGKSTTLRALVGLLRPSGGEALVEGAPFAALPSPATRVGVHMDGFGFEVGITARRHLDIVRLAVGAHRARVDEVLEEVELLAHARRRVKTFSTGMAQRLGLAAALVGSPRILVLDEPASGLDPEGIRWLRRYLRRFADAGGSVLISSHQLAEIEQIVDEVVIVNRTALFTGPLADLVGDSAHTLEDRYFELVEGSRA